MDEPIGARIETLLAQSATLQAESERMQRETREFLQLEDQLDAERRKTGTFLLDKCLPVLTAIVGGIAYVLIEQKVETAWQTWFFRISGLSLALLILIILLRTWLEPFIVYHFKAELLAIKHQQPRPPRHWLSRYADRIEEISLVLVVLLLLVGLSLAGLATMLHSI